MIRRSNASRNVLLATPIMAVLAGATITFSAPARCSADGNIRGATSEWFRSEPPRGPGDPFAPTTPAAPFAAAATPAAVDPGANVPVVAADPVPAAPAPAAAVVDPAVALIAPQAAPPLPAPIPAPRDEAPRRPSFPENFTNGYGSAYNSGAYSDYPSAEVYSFVVAQARATTARAMFRRAETELSMAFRNAQLNFERSQAFQDAVREEKAAYENLNNARRNAFRSLATDPKYQRLSALRQDLSEQIAERRAAHDALPDEILAMAVLKMGYAVDMRAIEANALSADGGEAKAAQDRLVAAGSRVALLRAHYDDSLRANSEIVMARRNLEDARISKLTADAYLNGSAAAGQEALDYAYYLHRRRGYNADAYGYGYNGYGNVGSGYGGMRY